mgnify:CR=1 FL=1
MSEKRIEMLSMDVMEVMRDFQMDSLQIQRADDFDDSLSAVFHNRPFAALISSLYYDGIDIS